MRVVRRLGGCNGPFVWLVALAAGMAVASTELALAEPATDGSAAAVKDNATQAELDQHRKIDELQQQLLPLLRAGGNDAEVRKLAAQLTKEIDRRSERDVINPSDPFAPPPIDRGRNAQALIADDPNPFDNELPSPSGGEALKSLAAIQRKLAENAKQIAQHEAYIRELAESQQTQRRHTEQPIEGAVAQIFPLRHAKAAEAAGTLESLFGAQVRVAVDERSNNLVVSGKEKSLEAVRTLLEGLDQPGVAANEGGAVDASPDRTVLLRIFWLADGLPGNEGQDPNDFLPSAVIDAMARLGLNGPRLVTQTVNSLAVRDGVEVRFATQVPAVLLGQHATLHCTGGMSPMDGDRTGVDVDIAVSGPAINCELKGSLATPLGHYMVLGTANSVIAEPMMMGGGEMEMGGGGRGMMRGGRGGEGGFGAADPAAVPGAEGGMGMEGMAPQTPKYNTSRFAFVVQVIEGESFPAEE